MVIEDVKSEIKISGNLLLRAYHLIIWVDNFFFFFFLSAFLKAVFWIPLLLMKNLPLFL